MSLVWLRKFFLQCLRDLPRAVLVIFRVVNCLEIRSTESVRKCSISRRRRSLTTIFRVSCCANWQKMEGGFTSGNKKNKRVVIEKWPIKYLYVTSLPLEILLPMSESFFCCIFFQSCIC